MFGRRMKALEQRVADLEAALGYVASAKFYREHPQYTSDSTRVLLYALIKKTGFEISKPTEGGKLIPLTTSKETTR